MLRNFPRLISIIPIPTMSSRRISHMSKSNKGVGAESQKRSRATTTLSPHLLRGLKGTVKNLKMRKGK
jgi:hypothetical protein